ncbi:MAG: hypothetical protein NTY11_00685 [Candidatus Parcubacteria bacterium]|nr:hypothetical protein [Candidatus Parcubacteria bacterium]
MIDWLSERYADACRREDLKELGELQQMLSFFKILNFNELGAVELREYTSVNPGIIAKLILFLRLFPLNSRMFCSIAEALSSQSRKAIAALA